MKKKAMNVCLLKGCPHLETKITTKNVTTKRRGIR